MRCCGVCTLTLYCTPFCGLSQTLGAVCPLEARETRRSEATSRWVSPSPAARTRSTATASSGALARCWRYTSTAPGTAARRRSRKRARARLSARLVPATWTSTGAGSPALRICPTMSADWKNTSTCGNRSRSRWRMRRAYSAVGRVRASVRVTSMSASVTPVVGLSEKARLVSEVLGMPTLSRMVPSSPGGMTSRMAASTPATRRAVSSRRVPTGARRWRRSCPASTAGKKSCPSHGRRAAPEAATRSAPTSTPRGRATRVPSAAR